MSFRILMRLCVVLLCGMAGMWHAPAQARDDTGQDILVWDIEARSGVSVDTADLITSLVAAELSKTRRNVITKNDVEQALLIQQERQRCGDDVSCMAEIGNALGSRDAVMGTIGRLGQTWVLSLQRIDIRKVNVHKRVACSVTGAVDALIPRLPAMAARLFPDELSAARAIAAASHGIMEIETTPPGATVTIDGMDSVTAPTAVNLAPGQYSIVATAADHETVQKHITIVEDKATGVHLNLPATHGYLTLAVQPPEATITLDGHSVTPGEIPIRLPVGSHSITASHEGYVEYRHTLSITDAKKIHHAIRLQKPGTLLVKTTPANATLLLDGEPAGNAGTPLTVPPGDHDIIVQAKGYHQKLRAVEIAEEQHVTVEVSLRLKSELDAYEIWGWSLLGTSGAAMIFGGVATWQYTEDTSSTGWKAAMGAGWGIAGAALITSFALLIHATEEDPAEWVDEPMATVAPAIGPDHLGAAVLVQW